MPSEHVGLMVDVMFVLFTFVLFWLGIHVAYFVMIGGW